MSDTVKSARIYEMRKFEKLNDEELDLLQTFLSLPWGSTDKSRSRIRRSLQVDLDDEATLRRCGHDGLEIARLAREYLENDGSNGHYEADKCFDAREKLMKAIKNEH